MMQGYLIQILTVSLLCGLIETLAPAGEREGLRRAVRLVTALCLLCLMVAPLREARERLRSFDLGGWAREMEEGGSEELERLMEEKLSAVTREQLESELYRLLDGQFGISRQDCSLTVGLEEEDGVLTVREVWIALRGRAVLRDPRAIEAAVEEAWQCGCTVSIGGE